MLVFSECKLVKRPFNGHLKPVYSKWKTGKYSKFLHELLVSFNVYTNLQVSDNILISSSVKGWFITFHKFVLLSSSAILLPLIVGKAVEKLEKYSLRHILSETHERRPLSYNDSIILAQDNKHSVCYTRICYSFVHLRLRRNTCSTSQLIFRLFYWRCCKK